MAEVGSVDEIARSTISGWAIDTDNPSRPVDVIISVNGKQRERLTADKPRDELVKRLRRVVRVELHDAVTPAHGFEYEIDPALSVFREHRIEVTLAESGASLNRGTQVYTPPPAGRTSLLPLLVLASGRSGTTLLMQHLARHPDIVAAARYPFETKLATYYSDAYRVLVSGADRKRSTKPSTLRGSQYAIGFNPYNRPASYRSLTKTPGLMEEFYEDEVPKILLDTFSKLLMGHYGRLQQDQGKANARFFAEKAAPAETVRFGSRLMCGETREILLLRDPRDILCSSQSFWNATRETAMKSLAAITTRLQRIHAEKSKHTFVVKYEDLVTSQRETLSRIFAFLDLEDHDTSEDSGRGTSFLAKHATSASPAASIGRWRNELGKDDIDQCNRVFERFLERFGYA
jgi:hypothetical protein